MSTPTARNSAELSNRKALTIGAVAKILGQEFDDVSISKIRYLEDQKLLSPRRTPGGYRLYSQADVERLRTILRLQRDEFLPLRVIRQELAAGGERDEAKARTAAARRAVSIEQAAGAQLTIDQLSDDTGASPSLIAEASRSTASSSPRARGALASTATPIARSSRQRPSSPATASRGATSRSSARPPIGKRRCSSRSWGPRCSRAIRRGAAKRLRPSRRSPPPSAT